MSLFHTSTTAQQRENNIDEEKGAYGLFLDFAQTTDGTANGGGRRSAVDVGAAGNRLVALGASPDSDALALHRLFATEDAGVLGVLSNLHLLDGLSQGGTITRAVLAGDSDLLRALRHLPAGVSWTIYQSTTKDGA